MASLDFTPFYGPVQLCSCSSCCAAANERMPHRGLRESTGLRTWVAKIKFDLAGNKLPVPPKNEQQQKRTTRELEAFAVHLDTEARPHSVVVLLGLVGTDQQAFLTLTGLFLNTWVLSSVVPCDASGSCAGRRKGLCACGLSDGERACSTRKRATGVSHSRGLHR